MHYFGQEETAVEAGMKKASSLIKEVEINHRLDQLNLKLHKIVIRLINFAVNFIGQRTGTHKEWLAIQDEIKDSTELAPEARMRLSRRHELFEEQVLPKPRNLLLALVPLVVIWAGKSLITGKLQERKFEKHLTAKRQKRRQEQLKKAAAKRRSKGLPGKRLKKRKKK
jgi:hypothetical protein